eukprot:3838162-Karenia_brevis.AAC.1
MQTYNSAVDEPDKLHMQSAPEQPFRQQALSRAVDSKSHKEFLGDLNDSDRKQVLSETLQGASGFLEAIPCKDS